MVSLILWFIRADIVLAGLYTLLVGRWELFFISTLALVFSFLPGIIEGKYKIDLPIEFEIAIVGFIYMSIFLGEYRNAYESIIWWDGFLHIASGVFFAFLAFVFLYTLIINKKLKASPFIIALITFNFSMGIGAIWEIFEFGMDSIFGLNMQKNGLNDTMWDLIVNGIGALGVSYAGYRILKEDRKVGLVYQALNRLLNDNPQIRKGKIHDR